MTLFHCAKCRRGIRYTRDPADTQPGVCEACGEMVCERCIDDDDEFRRCKECVKEGNFAPWMLEHLEMAGA